MTGRSREGLAWATMAAATLAVELGAYAAARAVGAYPRFAVLSALAASFGWIAVACGAYAASAATAFRAAFRVGIVTDNSAVALVVLCLTAFDASTGTRLVGLAAAGQIYLMYLAVGWFSAALARLPRTPWARQAAAVAASFAVALALSTPLWLDGTIHRMTRGSIQRAQDTAGLAIAVNPFYAATGALADRTGYVWHQKSDVLYGRSSIGLEVPPPPVSWYAPVLWFAIPAAAATALACLRRRRQAT